MCLGKLADYEVKRKWGYKVIYRYTDGEGVAVTTLQCERIPFNRWVSDERRQTLKTEGEGELSYPTGFHVYVTKRGAEDWCGKDERIVKVDFDNVVATGYQEGYLTLHRNYKVVVARKIYIHKPREGK